MIHGPQNYYYNKIIRIHIIFSFSCPSEAAEKKRKQNFKSHVFGHFAP